MGLHKREKNGLLSYENPNYHLDPARLESAIYSDLYDMHEDKMPDDYDSYLDNRRVEDEASSPLGKENEKCGLISPPQNGGEESPPPEKERADREDSEKSHAAVGPVPHCAEGPNDDLYAIPVKLRPKKESLPPGWEKHEDNDGPYYWHIKSGTIQREMPKMPPIEARESRISMVRDCSNLSEVKYDGPMTTSVTRSTTSGALDHDAHEAKRKEEMAYKRRSYPARPESDGRAVRFFVRSLGWVEISEADLTPERSSRAVNKCIVDLSLGRNDLLDQVGRWGDGKDLFMDLDDGALKLIDPESLNTLHTQPIHTIRVWGVGRDNGRLRVRGPRPRHPQAHVPRVPLRGARAGHRQRAARHLQAHHDRALAAAAAAALRPARRAPPPPRRRLLPHAHGRAAQDGARALPGQRGRGARLGHGRAQRRAAAAGAGDGAVGLARRGRGRGAVQHHGHRGGRRQPRGRGARALPVLPGHRPRRAPLRLHRAHAAGRLRGARLPRRAQLGRALQDHRGRLQAPLPEMPRRARRLLGPGQLEQRAGRDERLGQPALRRRQPRLARTGAEVARRLADWTTRVLNLESYHSAARHANLFSLVVRNIKYLDVNRFNVPSYLSFVALTLG